MKAFMSIWLACTLIITTVAISYIDTSSKSNLQINQNLTSPLGKYKMRLRANCSIQLMKYSAEQRQYNSASVIDPGLGKQCNSLILSLPSQSLMTDDGRIFKKPSLTQQITRMKMKVTDLGAVLLVSFFDGPDNTVQYIVDTFNGNNPEPEGEFLYNLQNRVSYRNKNDWKFDNVNGAISVSKSTGTNQLKTFDLQNYKLRETGFTDNQGETRYALIPGSTMKPKSGTRTCGGQSEGVFMHFDQHWPIVQVYDDDKYVVAEYSLDGSPKNVCPQKTFEYQGQCLTQCLTPFYKQFHGPSGSCVLSCQTDFTVDERQRTCTNSNLKPPSSYNFNSILNRQCPSQSSQYDYGCVCPSPKYYNFQTNNCGDACLDGFYEAAGICMSCPSRCKTCSLNSDTKQQYLQCTSCIDQSSSIPSCIPSSTQCTSTPNCQQCSRSQNGQQFCNKCLPFFSLSSNKLSCLYNCPIGEFSAIGNTGQGYCVKSSDGNMESYVGGVYNGVGYLIRKAGTCGGNMKIWRDRCVANCPAGTDQNIEKRCICPSEFATVQNDTCIRITDLPQNLGMYYSSTYNAFLNCPVGCLTCDGTICLKCQPGHILVASPSSSVCRQQNIHFSCNSQYYSYDKDNKLCIANSITKAASNITNCKTEIFGKCAVCKPGYFLNNNKVCASTCGVGYYATQGTCIKMLDNCDIPELSNSPIATPINPQILSTQAYQQYSSNHQEISNDPFTEILTIRDQLGIPITSSTTILGTFYAPRVACKLKSQTNANNNNNNNNNNTVVTPPSVSETCTDPLKSFMLLNNTCVSQCPANTYPFRTGSSRNIMCLTNTQCFYKNASTPYSMPDGSCVDQCPTATVATVFGNGQSIQCISQTECQKINPITPFQLANTMCASACPLGYAPQLQYTSLICTPTNQTQVQKSMNIDSSVYQIGKDGDLTYKLFYFVVDQPLNLSDVQVNYYKLGVNDSKPIPKVSQSLKQYLTDNVDYAQFNDKTYLAIRTAADQVVLDLSKNIKQFSSNSGNRLSSSIYGVSSNQNRLQNVHSWLAIIAFVLSLLLIILHVIYIGNELLYKVDHYLIFAQSLFYFSFVHLLINSSIAQYYYGFLWSHFGFFPNYFRPTIPGGYMQSYGANGILNDGNFVPNAYRLLTGDANFIRNAGFSFSLLCTFLVAFLVVVGVILLIKKICKKYQIWYKRIAKQALIAAWQFVSMNIFYWAVAHLLTNRNRLFSGSQNQPAQHISFRNSCSAAAIAWICIYGVYMILRFIKNKIGGLYMFKRLAIATILAAAAYHNNGNGLYKLFLIPLVALQVVFMVLRFLIQKPYLRRQKVFIVLETILILICYFTIFLWNDTGFISVFVSLVLFFFIFLLVSDLLDVYLDNKDEYYGDDVKVLPGLRQKQKLDAKDYEQLENYGSIPESDRRLRNQ